MTKTRFGVSLMPNDWDGQHHEPGSPLLARRRALLGLMSQAGMDHVMLGDHVVFRGGQGTDGLIEAATVIAMQEELDVYMSVYLLVLRHPVLVARQIITMDQLGPGRLTLGVGVGGDDRREVSASGVDPASRGRRMDESLMLLRRLLAGESVSFDGEFFSLDEVALLPTPAAPVPVVVGGRSDAALRRAGRLGDGWLGIWNSVNRFTEATASVEQHALDAGRRDVQWQHGMTFWCGFGADRREAQAAVSPVMEGVYRLPFDKFARYVPHGTPQQVAETVAPYLEAGCTTVNFIAMAASQEAAIEGAAEATRILRAAGH